MPHIPEHQSPGEPPIGTTPGEGSTASDAMGWLTGRSRPEREFYNAFRTWAIDKFGFWTVSSQVQFTFNNFQSSSEYQQWLQEDAPGWGTVGERDAATVEATRVGLEEKLQEDGTFLGIDLTREEIEFLIGLGWTLDESTGPLGKVTGTYVPPDRDEPEDEIGPLQQLIEERLYYRVTTHPDGSTTNTFYEPDGITEIPEHAARNMLNDYNLAEATKGEPTTYQEMMLAESAAARVEGARQFDIEQARLAAGQTAEQQAEVQRLENELRWQELKDELLGSLTGPGDWITRWQLENQTNPFIKTEPQPSPRIVMAGEQVSGPQDIFVGTLEEAQAAGASQFVPEEMFNQVKGATPTGFAEPGKILDIDDLFYGTNGNGTIAPVSGTTSDEQEQQARWRALGQNPRFTGGVGWTTGLSEAQEEPIPVADTPLAPSWLKQFAPGQQTGQPITQERIAPLSGQQISRTPPSHLKGLGGFVEFSGQSWEDLMRQTQVMQPQPPSLGRRRRTASWQRTGR